MADEHETDPFDQASRIEEEARSRAEAAVRGRVRCGDWRVISANWCETCGDFIPVARRRAVPGVRLCVSCQADAERRR